MLPPRRTNVHAGRDPDASIRATDIDASQARISAVRKQYLCDPFITAVVPRSHLVPARPPLINIGTYIRSEAIDELVIQWLELVGTSGTKSQIVSLGAGSDTRFWRIATGPLGQRGRLRELLARYLELDFSENTARKVDAIRQNDALRTVVGGFTATDSSLTSDIYAICDVDLRNYQTEFPEFLASVPDGSSNLAKVLLDRSLPTLIIAECVLVYMNQDHSDGLFEWFTDTFSVVGAIVYEMFGLNDSFGRVMRENLQTRNVALPGVDAYPALDGQRRRFINHGFTNAHSLSLRTIRNQYISRDELDRIAQLELLDEIEELELVLDHYVIAWGIKYPASAAMGIASWALRPKVRPGVVPESE